jgi:hypothetical protein
LYADEPPSKKIAVSSQTSIDSSRPASPHTTALVEECTPSTATNTIVPNELDNPFVTSENNEKKPKESLFIRKLRESYLELTVARELIEKTKKAYEVANVSANKLSQSMRQFLGFQRASMTDFAQRAFPSGGLVPPIFVSQDKLSELDHIVTQARENKQSSAATCAFIQEAAGVGLNDEEREEFLMVLSAKIDLIKAEKEFGEAKQAYADLRERKNNGLDLRTESSD